MVSRHFPHLALRSKILGPDEAWANLQFLAMADEGAAAKDDVLYMGQKMSSSVEWRVSLLCFVVAEELQVASPLLVSDLPAVSGLIRQ